MVISSRMKGTVVTPIMNFHHRKVRKTIMKWLLDHSHQRVWHVCGVWQTKNVTVPDAVVD
ncbi:hypothetical protein NQZ68_034289 [Dissostichus eleginoides]|nr:hypothetical protein NQZ68_034289 [Dissostichus eleginoides]